MQTYFCRCAAAHRYSSYIVHRTPQVDFVTSNWFFKLNDNTPAATNPLFMILFSLLFSNLQFEDCTLPIIACFASRMPDIRYFRKIENE